MTSVLTWPGKAESRLEAERRTPGTELRFRPEKSRDAETTGNVYVEGDNLDALKLLLKEYRGAVKLIYIDPPYNTGGSDFAYRDDFRGGASADRHDAWLSMFYPRLFLAADFLAEDGAIFISLDDNEYANAHKLCEEVFGEENRVATFIWEKRKTRENRRAFSENHEYILCFAKNRNLFEKTRNPLPVTGETLGRYDNPDDDPRGPWQSVAVTAQSGHGTPAQFYAVTTPSGRMVELPSGNCWRFTEARLNELIADGRIWFGKRGGSVPRQKVFLSERKTGLTPQTIWPADEAGTTASAKRALNSLFGGRTVFETPKPIELLKRIIHIGAGREDVILDFFSGSATTAHATLALNAEDGGRRRFLCIQSREPVLAGSEAAALNLPTIADIGRERIRLAGNALGGATDSSLDIGFKVFEIQ